MPFPESERVIYRHNPLEQVICQLKFPTLLRIESELPAKFQERVRDRYPIFSEPQPLGPGPELPDEIRKLVGSVLPIRPTRVYEFASADGHWKLTLSKDFIALVCLHYNYRRWEQFTEFLKIPLLALVQEYSPAFFSRVGLRYRNVIRRSTLGLKDAPWRDLLKPYIVAELATPIDDKVEAAAHQVVVQFEAKQGKVTINHGLASLEDAQEACYVIDNDFFTEERTEVKDADKKLDYFHGQSGNLFQWCISPQLHAAMEPELVR